MWVTPPRRPSPERPPQSGAEQLVRTAAGMEFYFFSIFFFFAGTVILITTLVKLAAHELEPPVFAVLFFGALVLLGIGGLLVRQGKAMGNRIVARASGAVSNAAGTSVPTPQAAVNVARGTVAGPAAAATVAPVPPAAVDDTREVVAVGEREAASLLNVANVTSLRIAGIGVFGFGCLIVVVTLLTAYQLGKAEKWPTTQAVVANVTRFVTTEHDANKNRDVTVWRRHVTFTYTVAGRPYSSVQDFRDEDPAVFTPGTAYTVHYNPSDPAQIAIFVSPPGTVALVGVIFGGTIMTIGTLFFLRSRKLENALSS
jgi:hypothetical protein